MQAVHGVIQGKGEDGQRAIQPVASRIAQLGRQALLGPREIPPVGQPDGPQVCERADVRVRAYDVVVVVGKIIQKGNRETE
jgi:hypothetical protein